MAILGKLDGSYRSHNEWALLQKNWIGRWQPVGVVPELKLGATPGSFSQSTGTLIMELQINQF